jgi:hypothetical protein
VNIGTRVHRSTQAPEAWIRVRFSHRRRTSKHSRRPVKTGRKEPFRIKPHLREMPSHNGHFSRSHICPALPLVQENCQDPPWFNRACRRKEPATRLFETVSSFAMQTMFAMQTIPAHRGWPASPAAKRGRWIESCSLNLRGKIERKLDRSKCRLRNGRKAVSWWVRLWIENQSLLWRFLCGGLGPEEGTGCCQTFWTVQDKVKLPLDCSSQR